MDDEKYRYYREERRDAIKESNASFRIFDKAMVVLGSFFFVVSAGLAFSYHPVPGFLLAACIWFAVSLSAILISFLFSASAYGKYIASLDAEVVNEDRAGGEAKYTNLWSKVTTALNWVSAIALFAGLFDIVYELIRRAD